ncbi:MAG: glycosyltransferase N-terminal domain-containing protein [Bacteroidota bacterium]|nr:glycosyltransferase N-terminal domain-containing protein [Bacteroidota bacterium]
MILFYNLFLIVYKAGIYIVSSWNRKAKLWITGRRNVFQKLKQSLPASDHLHKTIWMHCASLGEFEQGRPVLRKIKEEDPGVIIILTFFSPSGYEIVKNNKDFENVFYLPMDSVVHARKWMNMVNPDLVLWVKYEYWHYYLQEIKKRNIPLLMVSGVYMHDQVFFKWYGSFYRNMLNSFTHFFVQNENSKEQLKKIIAEERITVSGDTRCDRVINIAENFIEVPGIADFCGDSKVVVAGSTWEDDEAEWIHYVKQHSEIKFIIAPHEIDQENLADVKKEFPGSVFYSEYMASSFVNAGEINCLIIDNIGTLSRLYHYATIAYVGGGYGENGLHNILEAAVYGKPVIFGPEYEKNFEARELIDCTGAISIESAIELEKVADSLLNNQAELLSRSHAAKNYVYKNAGATDTIIQFINSKG